MTVPAMESGDDLNLYLAAINEDLGADAKIEAVGENGFIVLSVKASEAAAVASFQVKVPRVTKGNATIDDLVEDVNRVLDDPAANSRVLKPYRAPWKLGV